MIVLDASALVELLLDTSIGQAVAVRIADPTLGLHVPHLADVEVVQALRRYAKDGELDAATAAVARNAARKTAISRVTTSTLHPRRPFENAAALRSV